ncbi:damage-control phosphatase ARMT1 family protein [Kitasatospora acidiphila]|nr:damage-control phosphatase ARMT1 family protein [Kitasatospora acidiphila]
MPDAPVILSGDPGSFPWSVFHERHPKLLRQVLDALPYGPAERRHVEQLLAESTTGVLTPLPPDAPDHEQWLRWGERLWGLPWGEVPFLWAESYFYRRLLHATGYFTSGAWHGVDPFGPFKSAELANPTVDDELATLSALLDLPEAKRRAALLTSALWGNRADLGFRITNDPGSVTATGLLVDDGPLLWRELERTAGGRVDLVADNAGRELLPDLVLTDHLLTSGLAAEMALWVKPQPYYVSDAMMADVLAAVGRLRRSKAGAIGDRLWRAIGDGTLTVRTHAFFCAPLPYHELPAELAAEFAGATLTILKGDLNYRRLVGDRLWPPTTPFAEAAGHFPSPVAALRTLKSDVVTGLPEAAVRELDGTGEAWRTSGRYGVVQVCNAG